MSQILYRLLLNSTSLATLLALLAPLLSPLAALSLLTDAAAASTLEANTSSLQVAELPEDQLKDDDDDDDDDGDDDDDDDDDNDDDDDDDGDRVDSEYIRETTTTTTVTEVTYTDLATDYWASGFIYRLASLDVVSGYPDGEFLPNSYLTKAHYAAMVTKAFNKTAVREVVNIRNVSQYYWAYDALQEAYAEGWIDLDDDTFNPEATLTKLEMWVMLARSLGYTEITSTTTTVEEILSVFTDADTIPVEYRGIVAALVERGILVSYPTTTELNLFEMVTRAEACSYLYQAMASMNLVEMFYSQYIVDVVGLFEETTNTTTETTVETTTDTNTVITEGDDDDDDDDDDDGSNCNQGRGNGSEGCDPGNSRPHGGSNDGD